MHDPRALLLGCAQAALRAVDAGSATARAVREAPPPTPWRLLAMGKAAEAMAGGALRAAGRPPSAGLVVVARPTDPRILPGCEVLRGEHPVPGTGSLQAGVRVLRWLAAGGPHEHLLVLLSGGASSLVEALPDGLSLPVWQAASARLLADGASIVDINRARLAHSRIKAGRLAAGWRGRSAQVLLVSDVPPGAEASVGSGPFHAGPWRPAPIPGLPEVPLPADLPHIPHTVLLDNASARAAVVAHAQEAGLRVMDHGHRLAGEPEAAAREVLAQVDRAGPGLHVFGGETTPRLPTHPGRGGRCQHLALAAACTIAGRTDTVLLAFGTDGRDGPGEAAGALVDGGTQERGRSEGLSVESALASADSGSFLAASGDLVDTGPTGTNVADLVLVWRAD